jgi:hypothetical protein
MRKNNILNRGQKNIPLLFIKKYGKKYQCFWEQHSLGRLR